MIYTVTFNPSLDYIVRLDDLRLGEINRVNYEQVTGLKGVELGVERVDVDKIVRTNERGGPGADGSLRNDVHVTLLRDGGVVEDETSGSVDGGRSSTHAHELVLLVENREVPADGGLRGAKCRQELRGGHRPPLAHKAEDDVLTLTGKHARYLPQLARTQAMPTQRSTLARMVLQPECGTLTLPQRNAVRVPHATIISQLLSSSIFFGQIQSTRRKTAESN